MEEIGTILMNSEDDAETNRIRDQLLEIPGDLSLDWIWIHGAIDFGPADGAMTDDASCLLTLAMQVTSAIPMSCLPVLGRVHDSDNVSLLFAMQLRGTVVTENACGSLERAPQALIDVLDWIEGDV